MSVDLNLLSDSDLMALQKQDLNSMSDAGLKIIAGGSAPKSSVTVQAAPNQPNPFASNEGGAAFGRPNVRGQLNVQAEPRPLESALAGATKSMVTDPVLGTAQLLSGGTMGNNAIKNIQSQADVYKDANPGSYLTGQIGGAIAPVVAGGGAIGAIPSFQRATASAAAKAPVMTNVAKGAGYGALGSTFTPDAQGTDPVETMGNRMGRMLMDTTIGAALPAAGAAAKPAWNAIKKGASEVLGLTTGTGGESVRQAYKAGKTGNQDFIDNMEGNSSIKEILESAQSALGQMKQNRREAFEKGFESTKKNQVFLDFKPIEDKFNQTIKNLEHTGVNGVSVSKVGEKTTKEVDQIKKLITEWKSKPEVHTAEGLDALKRRIDDLWSNDMSNETKSIITQTRNVVKNTVAKQDKNYAKTMKDYEEALGLEREIEQALGLGNKKSVDTAIRKLQSITRNNANTNYGYRSELADIIKKETGTDIRPALAGQQMNDYVPRGLNKLAGTASVLTPALWATLPFQSPKLMGKMLYKMGETSSKIPSAKMTDEQKKMAQLLIQESILKGKEE